MMTFEDPKKAWEIDHDWKYIGVSRRDYYNNNFNSFKTYECSYCESFYYGEGTNDEVDVFKYISPFRPKDSGCQVLYVIERLKKNIKELNEDINEYENVFKSFNMLLEMNKR